MLIVSHHSARAHRSKHAKQRTTTASRAFRVRLVSVLPLTTSLMLPSFWVMPLRVAGLAALTALLARGTAFSSLTRLRTAARRVLFVWIVSIVPCDAAGDGGRREGCTHAVHDGWVGDAGGGLRGSGEVRCVRRGWARSAASRRLDQVVPDARVGR